MSERKAVTRIVLALGLASVQVFADDSHPKRGHRTVGDLLKRIEETTSKVKFEKSKSALPAFKKSQELVKAPSKVNLTEVKPPSRSTLYYEEGTNEGQLDHITDEGIRQLYKLTQQFKNSKRRGELWLRLAELYVEKSRLVEFRIQQKYDNQIHEFQAGKTKIRPKLDLAGAQEYNKRAVQLYEWFIRDFPNDPKVDQALFFLGYNFFELDKPEVGKGFYQKLTREHPDSPYIEESNFALGEYYFDREQWNDALKHYRAVAANKRARLYSFALYKTAWCEYKTGKVKEALASLEHVIKAGRQAKGQNDSSAGGASRIRLASEAQKDLVMFYAEAGTANGARAYFAEIAGEKQTFPLLEKLAYYYVDTGHREEARQIFRDLIAEKPNAPKAYDYQYQIVTMFVSADRGEIFKNELYTWIQTYSPSGEWARANAKDKELVQRANQLIETTLRNFILQQHQTAQNSRVPSAQKAAKTGYELYFATFKEGAKLDEMHFFFAELLFDMGEFDLAAQQYGWIIDNAPKSKYFEKSTLNMVLAAEKGLPKEDELKKMVGESLEARPFSPKVQTFEKAATRYMTAFPKGENVPAMKYKLAALYYYHNQFDKALEAFKSIIKQYPKSQYAQYSANLTLDIFNLRKDYGGLESAGQDILNNDDLKNSAVGAQVKSVIERAQFKKAQDLEAKKDYVGAAASYEDFAKKNPGGDLGLSALYNAAINYERAGEVAKAITMYSAVVADHSAVHEDLKSKSSQYLPPLYEKLGQYKKAADAYEAYANKHPKEKDSATFYNNAAIIRDGMNAYGAAINDYQAYFDKTHGNDRFDAIFAMARLEERKGNTTKAQDHYKQYYEAGNRNPEQRIESAWRIAKIFSKRNRPNDADEWYKKVAYQQRTHSTAEHPIGVGYAAEIAYNRIYKTYTDLRALKIPNNPAKQQGAVQEKLKLLNRLKDQLKEVIRFDDGPYVVQSLSLVGQAYQHMAASIYAVPLPAGLSEDDKKTYKAGVDKIAKPFQDEAVKNYESAIERGFKLEGYGEGLLTAQRELNKLDSTKYPDYGERAAATQLTDRLDVESDPDLGPAFKSRDEQLIIDSASKKLGKDANDLKVLNALGVFYLESSKLGLARIIFARAEKAHASEPALINNVGVVDLKDDKARPAVANFRKALDARANYAIAAANLGAIFVEYKDYAKAGDLLERGYQSLKGDLKKGAALDVANNYALSLSAAGKYDRAREIMEAILKADSGNVTALLNYTILLIYKVKDRKEGQKQLDRLKFLSDDAKTRPIFEKMDKTLLDPNG